MMGIFERELQKNVRIKERPCNDSSFNQSEPNLCNDQRKGGDYDNGNHTPVSTDVHDENSL